MRIVGSLLAAFWLALYSPTLMAHHPGTDLDEVMGDKEKFFEVKDEDSPDFILRDAEGSVFELSKFAEKILVLHFIYTGCPDVCPLHAQKIAEIQAMINQSPMKDMVRFVTITTDPKTDIPEVLRAYGPAQGLDPVNWTFLTTMPDQSEDSTRALAQAFGHKFIKTEDGYQVHSVVTHVIDRDSRWAANFHGLRFESVNMVLYINGLINNAVAPGQPADDSFFKSLKSLF